MLVRKIRHQGGQGNGPSTNHSDDNKDACVEALWHSLTPFRSFIVTLGWILGKPLTLLETFETIVLFLSCEAPASTFAT